MANSDDFTGILRFDGLSGALATQDRLSGGAITNHEFIYMASSFTTELESGDSNSLETSFGSEALSHLNEELVSSNIHNNEEIVQRLHRENMEHRVERDRKDQLHILAIRSKHEEIETQKRRIENLESENEFLRQRGLALEHQIIDQNAQIIEGHSLALNYKAVLNRSTKMEAEHRSVIEQRNDLHKELLETNEQTEKLRQQNERLEGRMTELNKSMITQKLAFDEKLKEEQGSTDFWRRRYECELPTHHSNNDHNSPVVFGDQIENNCHESLVEAVCCTEDCSPCEETKVALSPRSPRDTQSDFSATNNNSPSSQRDTESEPMDNINKRTKSSTGTPVQGRRKIFFVDPTQLPHCKNCCTVFDDSRRADGQCRFHMLPPQPYPPWESLKKSGQTKPHRMRQFYWPCCEKTGQYQPPGCKVLRHHDIIFPSDSEE